MKRLKDLGLIDAVGLQMHLGGSTRYRKADLVQTMRAYELPVHITELDVDLRSVAGSQTQRFRKQARLYRRVLEAALEAGVTTINVWGLSDRYSWLELPSERNASPLSDPCLYDENLQPKPAYQAWVEVLQGFQVRLNEPSTPKCTSSGTRTPQKVADGPTCQVN